MSIGPPADDERWLVCSFSMENRRKVDQNCLRGPAVAGATLIPQIARGEGTCGLESLRPATAATELPLGFTAIWASDFAATQLLLKRRS